MPAVVLVIALAAVGAILVHFFKFILAIGFIAVAAVVLPRLIRHILKERYFASDEFLVSTATEY
jgi:energy-converting hydrogenase Eha subunit E